MHHARMEVLVKELAQLSMTATVNQTTMMGKTVQRIKIHAYHHRVKMAANVIVNHQ